MVAVKSGVVHNRIESNQHLTQADDTGVVPTMVYRYGCAHPNSMNLWLINGLFML